MQIETKEKASVTAVEEYWNRKNISILKNSGDIFLTGMEQFREEKYARNVLNESQKHSKYHSKRSC